MEKNQDFFTPSEINVFVLCLRYPVKRFCCITFGSASRTCSLLESLAVDIYFL